MFARFPSLTAAAVAVLRGVASLPGAPFDTANDRSLRVLQPGVSNALFDAAGVVTARAPKLHQAARIASLGLLDHIALRTRAIDVLLLAELEADTRQLVICGAGLDARAFRIPELRATVVYEVDHPATQELKRSRARVRKSTGNDLRFVTVDFERDSLDQKLAAAGHDVSRPTVWIWEGVTPYLLPEATRSTLEVISSRSSKGSLALVTYALPDMVNLPSLLRGPVDLAFGILGEPLLGRMTREQMAALARSTDFVLESDTGGRDWAVAHGRADAFPLVIEERLVALRRR